MKGFATTISVVLMLAALLYLVASIAHYSSLMNKANSDLAYLSQAQSQSDSASYGARKISEGYGATASLDGNRTTMGFSLSSLTAYRTAITGWAAFLSTYGSREATLNATDAALPKIYVQPQEISAWHSASGRSVSLLPGNATIKAYRVTISVVGSPVAVNKTGVAEALPSDPDAILLFVRAEGLGGASDEETLYVHNNTANTVSIESDGTVATVHIDNSSFGFDYLEGRNAYLTLDIETTSAPSYAELGRQAVSSASGSVEKNSRVLLG